MKPVYLIMLVMLGNLAFINVRPVGAHCDSVDGPLIPEVHRALADGNIAPVLKWVQPQYDAQVRRAFMQARAVRASGGQALNLADNYFVETVVRLHRTGEGAPYTGISTEAPAPITVLADNSIARNSSDIVMKPLLAHIEKSLHEKYTRVMAAKSEKDKSVEAGRRYVAAYVEYVHSLEALHKLIAEPHASHDSTATANHESHGNRAAAPGVKHPISHTKADNDLAAKDPIVKSTVAPSQGPISHH